MFVLTGFLSCFFFFCVRSAFELGSAVSNVCSGCASGYFYYNGNCYECDENCANCGASGCHQCNSNYARVYDDVFSIYYCELVEDCVNNCLNCQTSGDNLGCSQCEDGYFLATHSNGECLSCDEEFGNGDNACLFCGNGQGCQQCDSQGGYTRVYDESRNLFTCECTNDDLCGTSFNPIIIDFEDFGIYESNIYSADIYDGYKGLQWSGNSKVINVALDQISYPRGNGNFKLGLYNNVDELGTTTLYNSWGADIKIGETGDGTYFIIKSLKVCAMWQDGIGTTLTCDGLMTDDVVFTFVQELTTDAPMSYIELDQLYEIEELFCFTTGSSLREGLFSMDDIEIEIHD